MQKKIVQILVSLGILIGIWELVFLFGNFPAALFPSPLMTAKATGELWTSGLAGSTSSVTMAGHILVSLKRFAIGYSLSVVSAVLLGLIFGWYPNAFAFVNPVIQLIRPIAPVAWMPFIVLLIGIGDTPAIVIIFLAGFFPVLLSTVSAVGNLDPVYLKLAQNFGLGRWECLGKIVFPDIFPQIMTSLHLALSTAWIFLVSGEMVGSQSGLGFLIMDAKNCLRTDALLSTMFTIGAIGFLLDLLMKMIEKKVAGKWGVGTKAAVQAD